MKTNALVTRVTNETGEIITANVEVDFIYSDSTKLSEPEFNKCLDAVKWECTGKYSIRVEVFHERQLRHYYSTGLAFFPEISE